MPSSSSADSKSTMEKIEDNTLVFTVYVKASKHQIKQAVKKLHDIDMVKVSTLIRPDGEKKAYFQLPPNDDALDVANKSGIISNESSWLILNIKILHGKKIKIKKLLDKGFLGRQYTNHQ